MKTILALLFATAQLHAQITVPIVSSFDPITTGSVGPGTAGITFTEGPTDQVIRSLGVWDFSGTGLTEIHPVGLWRLDTQTLIGSAVVVPATATEIGSVWYQALAAPITLQAGHSYVLAAQYSDNSLDLAAFGAISAVVNGITLGDARLSSGSGFSFPDLSVPGANLGFFGPDATSALVPEPRTWSIVFGLLLAAFAFVRSAQASPRPTTHPGLPPELAKHGKKIVEPPANRPPVTPGNTHGQRPPVPPGLANYASP